MRPRITKATATGEGKLIRSPWFSPAGKKQLVKQLVPLIPDHHTYVEPFIGSGAVFFGKARTPREVINDLNPKISQAFTDLKGLTSSELADLQGRKWVGKRSLYLKLLKSEPQSRVDRLYKFMYVSIFSYGHKWGAGFNPGAEGQRTGLANRLPDANERMRGVIVRNGTYVPLMRQFDGPRSFFFLDPPYAGTNVNVGESKFDEVEFRKILDGLSGRFLVTYGTTGKLKTAGFRVKRITPPRSIRHMRGAAKHTTLPTLLISNYSLTAKSLAGLGEDAWEFEDAEHLVDVAKCEIGAVCSGDASYLVGRLVAGQAAGFITGTPRTAGGDYLMVSEPTDALPDPMGVGVVRMGKAIALASISGLDGEMRARIGDEAFMHFLDRETAGDGPFFYQPLRIVQKFEGPQPIHEVEPQARPTTGVACGRCGGMAEREITLDSGNTLPVCKADEKRARGLAIVGGDVVTGVRDLPIAKAGVKVDETENEFRVRLHEPGGFQDGSFRRIPIKESSPKIFGVVGRREGESTTTLQSLRFPKSEGWDAGKVRSWMASHPSVGKEHTDKAVWTTAFVNDLPDSAFLYIEPGGEKDAEGKTKPRSLRHFPVRDKSGAVDAAHLRNAIARIPQSTAEGLTDDRKRELQDRARRMLEQMEKMAKAQDVGTIRVFKDDKPDEAQYVLGIVLEPEVRDSQGDIYSAQEIEEAAHEFMANSQKVGLMHKKLLGQGATVVENYIAPVDFEIDGEKVKKGTWLMGIRVNDPQVWADVKAGRLTGLSIGGSALRVPENSAA